METRNLSHPADSDREAGRLTLWDLALGLALTAALCCVGCSLPAGELAQDSAPTWLDHDAAQQLDARFYDLEAAVAALEREQHLTQLEPAPPMRSGTWPAEDEAQLEPESAPDPSRWGWIDWLTLGASVLLGGAPLVLPRPRGHLVVAARSLAAAFGLLHTDAVNPMTRRTSGPGA